MKLIKKIGVITTVLVIFGQLTLMSALAQNTLPTLLWPSQSNNCIDPDVIFLWSTPASSTVTAYGIQISNTNVFTAPNIVHEAYGIAPVQNTAYEYVLPQYDHEYWWRVSTTFSDHSQSWTANTRHFHTAPARPTPTIPANAAICQPVVTTFHWSVSSLAARYDLEVYKGALKPANLIYSNTNITTTSYTVRMPEYEELYTWRVSSSYSNGCVTDWSTTSTFTTSQVEPQPLLPPDEAVGLSLTNSLSWTVATPHDFYILQVSEDSDFSALYTTVSGLTSNSYSLTVPDLNTIYYWRVSTSYTPCQSMWSESFNFRTRYNQPTLLSPLNHRICTPLHYRFQWNPVTDATAYRIQVATDPGFATGDIILDHAAIYELYYDVVLPQDVTTFYWRVRAEDPGNFGMWSDVWDLTTTVDKPDLINPANNTGGHGLIMAFRWEAKPVGTTYLLQVSDDQNFTNKLVNVAGLTSASYTYTLPRYNEEYYWRVTASYTACSSSWTDIGVFRTMLPAPILKTPGDDATGQPFGLLFNWDFVENATNYDFNLSTNAGFTIIIRGTRTGATSFLVTGLNPDTEYFWRVRAVNDEGVSAWSAVFSFKTHKAGPQIPLLEYPPNGAEMIPLTVTLKWKKANLALKYHLQVSGSNLFTANIVDNANLTSTSYTLADLDNYKVLYWRVSAINDSGETQFSQPWFFRTIAASVTAQPALQTPANNLVNLDVVDVIFSWLAVANAQFYELQVSKNDDTFQPTNIVLEDLNVNMLQKTGHNFDYLTKYYWRVRGKNEAGFGPWSLIWNYTTKQFVGVKEEQARLYNVGAYPNPFGSSVYINFHIPKDDNVIVKITNLLGQEVQTLVNEPLGAGDYNIPWNASIFESGVYLYTVRIGNFTTTNQLMLVR